MIEFQVLDGVSVDFQNWGDLRIWINQCVLQEGFEVGNLNYVFMSDQELLSYNQKYLNHDYFTDIITFDNTEGLLVGADILISVDRVRDNSKVLDNKYLDEFCRVVIHGVIHLMGYKDKTLEEAHIMRRMEETFLDLRSFT